MSLMPRLPQFKIPLPSFLLADGRADDILNMRFLVLFNLHLMGFEGVSGISRNKDVDYIHEGGRNDYPIMVRSKQKTPHKVTFRRGIVLRSVADETANFLGIPGLFSPQMSLESPGSVGVVFVINQYKEITAKYIFVSQGSIEWSVSELNAGTSKNLIESFTIVHGGFIVSGSNSEGEGNICL